jgi:hypothetical protein
MDATSHRRTFPTSEIAVFIGGLGAWCLAQAFQVSGVQNAAVACVLLTIGAGCFMFVALHHFRNSPKIGLGLCAAIAIVSILLGWWFITHGQSASAASPAQLAAAPASAVPPNEFKQYNYGSNNNIFQGPVTININPPFDPAGVVTVYEFDGIKRTISPGRSEAEVGAARTAHQTMLRLCASQVWKDLFDLSEAQIKDTDGKWVGAYAFRGIALIHLGKADEGNAQLAAVRELLQVRTQEQQRQFDDLVDKFGT